MCVLGTLALNACADLQYGKPMSDSAFDDAVAGAALLRKDAIAFKAAHDFKGKPAGDTMRSLQAEGFACGLEYLELLQPAAEGSLLPASRPTPLIVCTQPLASDEQLCLSRRVTLDVGWPDIGASKAVLLQQLDGSLVTHQTHHCTPRIARKTTLRTEALPSDHAS